MPEREEIISKLTQLPAIEMGQVAQDHEIWEKTEGSAHIKTTKERFPGEVPDSFPNPWIVYAMSVSGEPADKAKVIADFIKALGKPLRRSLNARSKSVPTFFIWDIRSLKQEE